MGLTLLQGHRRGQLFLQLPISGRTYGSQQDFAGIQRRGICVGITYAFHGDAKEIQAGKVVEASRELRPDPATIGSVVFFAWSCLSAQDHATAVETFAEADAVTVASTVRNAVADCQHALDASGGRRMSLTRPPSSCSCDGSASSWRLDAATSSFQYGMMLRESSTVQYQLTASQRTVETRTGSCGRR